MRRRDFLAGSTLASLAMLLPEAALAQSSRAALLNVETMQFTPFTVRQMARELAQKPFQKLERSLPPRFENLAYDIYRGIRFRPEKALWRGQGLPFEIQFFHRGFLYDARVDIFEVSGSNARRVMYAPDMFAFDNIEPPQPGDLGFAGFRIHAPINRADYYDEFCVFLGASYFRAVAKGQIYGLSARGLSIKTAETTGEEFPYFRAFWIEKPAQGANSLVVHALLDSESATAAYRFTIRPGEITAMDVEMALYPRVEIAQAGIAPLTSMFYFDAVNRRNIDDFRPAVHDSDVLSIFNGRGERLLRSLTNPSDLQVSTFLDLNPRGFGLMQRQRSFFDYYDLEARYERRPSLWVEPIGDWGEGAVALIEIPTKGEIHDNIVGFWRPKEPLHGGGEYLYTYRLHWCWDNPMPSDLGRFVKVRTGAGNVANSRLFVLEAVGGKLSKLPAETVLTAQVTSSAGRVVYPVLQPNPDLGGHRLSFNLVPEKAPAVELRAQIFRDNEPMSEVWTFRWTP